MSKVLTRVVSLTEQEMRALALSAVQNWPAEEEDGG